MIARSRVAPGSDIVAGGEDGGAPDAVEHLAAYRIDLADRLDLVAEEFQPDRPFLLVGGEDLHHIAPHPEGAAMEIDIIALYWISTSWRSRVVAIQFHPFFESE